MRLKRGLFLDRDGLINVPPPEEVRYVTCPEEFVLMPGIAEAIRYANQAGVPVGVVTNQKGIALGRYTIKDLEEIHDYMKTLLAQEGAEVQDIQFCPCSEEDECPCRKPLPGMIFASAKILGVDPAQSWMVGDQPRDLMAGKAAGCSTLGVGDADFPPEFTDQTLQRTQELPAWLAKHFPFQNSTKLQ